MHQYRVEISAEHGHAPRSCSSPSTVLCKTSGRLLVKSGGDDPKKNGELGAVRNKGAY